MSLRITMAAILATTCAGVAMGNSWTETGDAGQLLGAEQAVSGVGNLDSIIGSLSGNNDVDLYRINITDPSLFSASTVGGASFDTMLSLFTLDGYGVIHDDNDGGLQSTLSAGSIFSPTTAGQYLIAISSFINVPLSGAGAIFSFAPGDVAPDGNLVAGPDGSGGGSALSGWSDLGGSSGDYTIYLQGAAFVPLPTATGLGLAGLGVIGLRRRR